MKEGGSTAWDDGASGSVLLALLDQRPEVTWPLWISVSSSAMWCPCSGGSWRWGCLASRVTAAQHPTHQSLQTRGGLVTTSRSFPLRAGTRILTENDQVTLSLERNAVSSPAPAGALPHPARPGLPVGNGKPPQAWPPSPSLLCAPRPWLLATSHLPHCFSLSLPLHILKHWPFPGFCPWVSSLAIFWPSCGLMAQLHLYLYQTPGPVFRAPGLVNPVVGRGWGGFFLSRQGASHDDCPLGEHGQRPQRKVSAPQHILAPIAPFRDRQSSPLKVRDLPRQVGTCIDAASRIFYSTLAPPPPSCFSLKLSSSE